MLSFRISALSKFNMLKCRECWVRGLRRSMDASLQGDMGGKNLRKDVDVHGTFDDLGFSVQE